MSELDQEFGPLALELIDEFGKQISYTSVYQNAYDTTTGEASSTKISKLIKAVVENSNGYYSRGTLIQKANKKITISAFSFRIFFANILPKSGDTFQVDSDVFTIGEKGIVPIYSGELVAAYELYGAL